MQRNLGKEHSVKGTHSPKCPWGTVTVCLGNREQYSVPGSLPTQVSLAGHGKGFGFYSKSNMKQMENLKQKYNSFTFGKNTLAAVGRLDKTRGRTDIEEPHRRLL